MALDLTEVLKVTAPAAITGGTALLVVYLSNRKSNDQLSHEDRRRAIDWRKDLYVRLLEAIDRAERGIGRGFAWDEESLPYAEPSLWREEGGRLIAEVIALGSDEVKQLADEFQREHQAFYVLLRDAQELKKQGTRATEELNELRTRRARLLELARGIEAQVRLELRPPDTKRR